MPSAKVSSKHQISIPSDARRRLGIEPGDRLDVKVVDDALILRKRPEKASDRLWGIAAGKGYYEPDPVTYVRQLRDELERNVREREALVHPDAAGESRGDRPRRQRPDLRHRGE